MNVPAHDLVVLAGGTGRRLGGADKAEVVVAGTRLLDRVLAAGPAAGRLVVVGPPRPTRLPVVWCREEPHGGGPAAGVAAAMSLIGGPSVVVLAVDLPLVDAAAVARLLHAAAGHDGAIGVDQSGRDHPLLAAYDVDALRAALEDIGSLHGASMRAVVERLDVARIELAAAALDCDTWADVARAETAATVREAGG